MNPNTAVLKSPVGSVGSLLSNETIFGTNYIIGIRSLIKDMTKLLAEILVLIIYYFHLMIFQPESIANIFIVRMTPDLHMPARKVLSIK